MEKFKTKILLLLALLLQVTMVSCSDDSDEPTPDVTLYPSLIQGFVEPGKLYYERTNFNIEYIFSENGDKITGVRLKDFTVFPTGSYINHKSNSVEYARLLKEAGDVDAKNIPADAWNYLPLTKPIAKIGIAPQGSDQLPDLARNIDCARYFEISYVSYYDYIKNGYSWEGLTNPGPVYRMSLEQFNKLPEKHLVDANKITLHISPVVTDNYLDPRNIGDLSYSVVILFADGTSISNNFAVIDSYLSIQILNYVKNYGK